MANVANLSAHLSANTAQFEAGLRRAQTSLRQAETRMGSGARSLERTLTNSFQQSARSLSALDGPLGAVGGRMSSLATVARTSGLALGAAGVAVSAFALAMRQAVNIGEQMERSMLRTEALLRATGTASGQTAEGIRSFARELAGSTLASTQQVEAAAARLLTFRRVSGETFTRTLRLAQDLAEVGFGSLESATQALGRALEDPVSNLGALSKVGITFNETQREQIRLLVESGQLQRAQGLILDELQRRVGGAGPAANQGLSGAYDTLSQRVQEFFEALGNATLAGRVTNWVLREMADRVESVTMALDPSMISDVRRLELERTRLDELSASLRDVVRARQALEGLGGSALNAEVQAAYDAVIAQRALVQELQRTIDAREEQARVLGEAEQARMDADERAARQRRAAQAAAEESARAAERRQQQITQTIEALQLEGEALSEQHRLYEFEGRSLEEATVARQVLETQRRLGIDAASEEGHAIQRLIESRSRINQAMAEETQRRSQLNAQASRAEAIILRNRTAQEVFNDEIAELNDLMAVGAFGHGAEAAEQYERAVAAATARLDQANDSLRQAGLSAEDFTRTLTQGMEDAIMTGGRLSDSLRNIGHNLARMFAAAGARSLGNLLVSGVGSMLGGIGGGSSFSMAGSTAATGGFYADGGHPPLGKISVVGERGPELFVPHTRGTIISNEDMNRPAAGGGTTIFADMRGASLEAVQRLERFVGEMNGSIEQRAVGAMVAARQSGRLRESFR